MESTTKPVRIAAIADIHVSATDKNRWVEFFRTVSQQADVLLICGDLTDTGDESEAEILQAEMKSCTIPVVCVLGNHDYEKGRQKLIRQIVQEQHHVHVLDGEAVILHGVGFAGVKGFGGGFDGHMLSMFGETAMKAFVQEAVDEALHLDRALARLDQEHADIKKVALMHYSPMLETVKGEPEQIYPFLGSSRLAEPLVRRKVVAAFHGHAHAGTAKGMLSDIVPVYNVARHVLDTAHPAAGFFLLEL
ncbi:metallophosphoesterase [Chitinophaga pendula]|uniref:metallophosphoesterase family protein n=1 Tax=Chitinophaga TaxID=79328 RepID=UPI000BAF9826|nr:MULTISPECIES: metallophosphoesterase [Chitinophaga]ASZ15120.1 metallophosphoesterase [Chitinophaga sp. MD30]UCJ08193.1 metallophosphoesterase [Chitinophaga pendula]